MLFLQQKMSLGQFKFRLNIPRVKNKHFLVRVYLMLRQCLPKDGRGHRATDSAAVESSTFIVGEAAENDGFGLLGGVFGSVGTH